MKFTKQTKKVCILAVVLGILIALIALLLTDGDSKNTKSDAEKEQPVDEKPETIVFEVLPENVVGIEYLNAEEPFKLILKGDAWIVEDTPDLPIEQYVASGVARDLRAFSVIEIVETNAEDISKYGLEEPFATTIVHMADGSTVKFCVGSKVQGSDSYYVKIGDRNEIYDVSALRCASLMYSKNDLIAQVIHEANTEDIVAIDFSNANGEKFRVEHDMENLFEPWNITEPFAWKADTALIEDKLLRFAVFIEADDFVTNLTEEEMGLSNPSATVSVTTIDGKVHTFYVGTVAESENTAYVKAEGVHYPALVDSTIMQLTNLSKFDIIKRYISTAEYGKIQTAIVTGETEIDLNYAGLTLNGNAISEETAIKLYSDMCELEVDAAGTPISGSPVLTMKHTFKNGDVHTFNIYRQDAYFYAITMDGETFFKIKQDVYSDWIDLLNQYL